MTRRATKGHRDGNEKAIVEVLEAHGWRVDLCSSEGFPDLFCVRLTGAYLEQRWVDVKKPGGVVQLAQARLWDAWESLCVNVRVLESAEEARAWCLDRTAGHDWRRYPVDKRGRGSKKAKPKRWIPERLRKLKPRPGSGSP